MFFFPLINFTFLIILYQIHKRIFWITFVLETFLYAGGLWWIYHNFDRADNQVLYMFTLTGAGFILVFIAFFIAIFANHTRE
ncbi:hypothetical protein H7169_02080 [Candidatus Gracilibacteria bacterium]|nr:hypothetical protein [Candidatus Gracilibacteria bacterium]